MPELRWILALAGVGIVIFVYWFSRRRSGLGDRAEARVEPGFADEPERDAAAVSFGTGVDRRATDADLLPPISLGEASEPEAPRGLSARRDDPDAEPLSLDDVVPASSTDDFANSADDSEPSDRGQASGRADTGSRTAGEEERVVAIRLKAKRPAGLDGAKLLRAFAASDLKFGRFNIFHREAAAGLTAFSVASIVEPGSFDLDTLPTTGCPGVTLFMVLPGPSEPVLALDDMLSVARGLAADLDGELLDERGVSLTSQREAHLREDIAEYARRHGMNEAHGSPAGR